MKATRAMASLAAAVAVLGAVPASQAEKFEVLGMGGAGGMFTPISSPADPKLTFVSCDMSGSYRSLDGGRTWEMIDSMQLRSSRSCRPMFAGQAVYWVNGRQLRASRDKGKTWKPTLAGAPPWGAEAVTHLASPPGTPATILLGAGPAVYVSRDAGRTWKKGPSGRGACGGIASAGGRLHAAVGARLWGSADGGKTWQPAALPESGGEEIVALAGGGDGRRGVLFAVVRGRGVMRSPDAGKTWRTVLAPGGLARTDLADVVMPANQADVAYACNRQQVFRTADGGSTWRSCFHMQGPKANVERSWVQTEIKWGYYITRFGLGCNPADPKVVLVSTQGDFYRSDDGGRSWRQLMNHKVGVRAGDPGCRYRCNGLEVTSVWDFLFDPFDENRCYIAYTDIGFARSVDRGKTWIYSARGSGAWSNTFYKVIFDPHVAGRMYAAASNRHDIPHWTHVSSNTARHSGGVVVSDDRGVRWRPASRGLPERPCTSVCIDPASPKGRPTLYAALFEAGVYKSTDGAKSWAKKSAGLGYRGNLHVLQLQARPKTGELFCSITAHRHGSKFPVPGGLWKSTDGAETWTDVSQALDLRWATGFALHPTDAGTIYLCAATFPGGRQGGVYKTTDGGRHWTRILRDEDFARRRPPGYVHVMNVVLHPADPDIVYVCSSHGLWVSPDGGKTWRWVTGIPFGSAQNVAFDPKDAKTIYVTTFGGGTWRGPHLPGPRGQAGS